MTHGGAFDELLRRQEATSERQRALAELGRQWDHTVRVALRELALAQAGEGAPLVIPRTFGEAME